MTSSRNSPRTTLQHQLQRTGAQTLERPDPSYVRLLPDMATINRIYDEVANKGKQHRAEQQPLAELEAALAIVQRRVEAEHQLADLRTTLASVQRQIEERLRELVLQQLAPPVETPSQQVVNLLVESLKAKNEKEWLDYWRRSDRFAHINGLLDGILASMKVEMAHADFEEQQRQVQDKVVGHFEGSPEFHEMLCFADHSIRSAGRVVSAMIHRPIKDDERRKADAQNAQMFNWNVKWYRIAANALSMVAHRLAPADVSHDLLFQIAVFAREAGARAYHEASEGRRLRDEEDDANGCPPEPLSRNDAGARFLEEVADDDLAEVAEDIERYERP